MPLPVRRDRLISDSKSVNVWGFRYDAGSDHIWIPGNRTLITWPTSYSKMSDVVGNKRGINPLFHLSIKSNAVGFLPFQHVNGAMISQLESAGIPVDVNGYWWGFSGIIPHPSPVVLQNWASQAHKAFVDQVPTEVSLANFLYELKDIKGMIPKIESSFSKTASSNFLAFNFGVAPFVGDVKKLWSLADTVNKRLKYLKDTVGKPTKLTFKRDIPVDSWNGASSVLYDPDPPSTWFEDFRIEFRRVNYQGTFRASANLFQNLEGLDSVLGTAKAFAAASGFNNPAAIVWEAIPYSFVVDWFFHFQQSLDYLAIQPFGGEWRLEDVMYTLKEEWQFELWQVPSQRSEFLPYNNRKFLGSATVRRFIRELGLPVSSVFLTDGSLTPKQLALSLALLNQRR